MSAARAVRVDTAGRIPPYEQIRIQLAGLVHSGRLAEGDRLPTVRQLAADLGLANGTVSRTLPRAGVRRTDPQSPGRGHPGHWRAAGRPW
jgi:DNA-binding transcriptional MocR family regulator